MGAYQRNDKPSIREDLDRVFGLFPRLKERQHQKAGTLSGGEQQMVAIGRALMARPKLLLLDEPSMGLAPISSRRSSRSSREINTQGTPILLVEQNALMALDAASRGYVLETGKSRSKAPRRSCARTTRFARPTWARTSAPCRPPAAYLEREYGGASKKPIRASPPARPWAISSAGGTPCVGTKPERASRLMVAAARDDDRSEPVERGPAARPVGVGQERVAGAARAIGGERALVRRRCLLRRREPPTGVRPSRSA